MTASRSDRIAFLGFGLIGGSIASALRGAGSTARLAAWTPTGAGPAEGVRLGLLDAAAPDAAGAIEGADLVIIAGPPLAILDAIGDLGGPLRGRLAAGATITDVASTKGAICHAADEAGLRFVGGHPMAGRETTGVGAATAELFVDRPWVLVPGKHATARDVARVEALAIGVGARPMRLSADEHDAAAAAISHLPLVLAAALVESVASSVEGAPSWPLARMLAASGWRDMTRLARGDPAMGAGILATNPQRVVDRLVALRAAIDAWIGGLDGEPDPQAIRARLEAARAALDGRAGS